LTGDFAQSGAVEREVRIPLGDLCREALSQAPAAPLAALGRLFEGRYGDDGPGFLELCVMQHDLADDTASWQQAADGRLVAVVHIVDDLPQAAEGHTYVVEDDDISTLPEEIQPLAEFEIHRKVTGELPRLLGTGELPPAPPIPLWEADRRQALTAGVVAISLLVAAMLWFVGAILGFWPIPFAGSGGKLPPV
jgi:hypothetical protein